MPPFPYHVMLFLAREHHEELYRTAALRARARCARAAATVVRPRPLPLRLLGRVLGPR